MDAADWMERDWAEEIGRSGPPQSGSRLARTPRRTVPSPRSPRQAGSICTTAGTRKEMSSLTSSGRAIRLRCHHLARRFLGNTRRGTVSWPGNALDDCRGWFSTSTSPSSTVGERRRTSRQRAPKSPRPPWSRIGRSCGFGRSLSKHPIWFGLYSSRTAPVSEPCSVCMAGIGSNTPRVLVSRSKGE